MNFSPKYSYKDKMNVVIDCNTKPESDKEIDKNLKIFIYTCYSICMVILLSIPISEIIIGVLYKNEILCDTDLFINLDTWLIAKGSVECFVLLCLPFLFTSDKRSISKCIIVIIIYLFNIFSIIWIISGSVMFFRDCSQNLSTNLYSYIIFILACGYIGLLNLFLQKNELLSP